MKGKSPMCTRLVARGGCRRAFSKYQLSTLGELVAAQCCPMLNDRMLGQSRTLNGVFAFCDLASNSPSNFHLLCFIAIKAGQG